jgi:hypothetical protein
MWKTVLLLVQPASLQAKAPLCNWFLKPQPTRCYVYHMKLVVLKISKAI